MWAAQIRDSDVVRWPYGQAARSLIHERDIAAVAVRALTEDGHAGARYVLTGPETLTQVEQVHAIGDAIGRPLRWEELSREMPKPRSLGSPTRPSTPGRASSKHPRSSRRRWKTSRANRRAPLPSGRAITRRTSADGPY